MPQKLFSLPPVSFALEVWDTYSRVGVSRSAAALAYFLILTIFPLLLCVNLFIGLFHVSLEQVLAALDQLLPAQALSVMSDYLAYAADTRSPALLWAALSTIVVSASAGLRTLFLTMDELYEVRRDNGLGRIVLSVILSLLFLLTIYLSIVVIFTGDWFFWFLEGHLPQRLTELLPLAALSGLWKWMRYLLLFCFVLLLVLAIYRVGTPRAQARRGAVLASSLATALAIVACSVLFSWFIGISSRYTLLYGSLASLIILLVWLYLCGTILLLGAVIARVAGQRLARRQP